MQSLSAGISIVDISPEIGVQLKGYPYQTRENIGIHDPLYATCAILDNGETKIALIHADLVWFEKEFVARYRRQIANRIDTPASHILLSGSHTHSGPRIDAHIPDYERDQGWKIESAYLEELEELLIELALEANRNMQDARIGFGEGRAGAEAGIGGNRHNLDGPCDPKVGVIGIQDDASRWLGFWVRYSLHPTILQVENKLVSADFPGAIRAYLAKRHPGIPMLFAQGATGDQSSRFFRRDQSFEEVERFGQTIGAEASRVLDSLEMSDQITLAVTSTNVSPIWKILPPTQDLEQGIKHYQQKLERMEADPGSSYTDRQTCYLNRLGLEYTLAYVNIRSAGKKHPYELEVPLEIQAIRIGDACIVTIPGEIFVEFTLAIEEASPFQPTYVVTCANGASPGYFVTKDAIRKGVFEAGVSLMEPETGEIIVETSLELLSRLEKQ